MRLASIMTADPRCAQPDMRLDEALSIMDSAYVRHLPVVSTAGRLVGVVSDRDLLAATSWPTGIDAGGERGSRPRAASVRDVMTRPVVTAAPDDTLVTAVVHLAGRRIGCLPVVEKDILVGILSEMDVLGAYARQIDRAEPGEASNPGIEHLMTWHPTSAATDTTLAEARRLMSVNGIRHLPVVQEGLLVGMLSDRDLRRAHGSGRSKDTAVEEVMTRPVVSLTTEASTRDAAQAIVRGRISALAIVAPEPPSSLVGIVTISDLLEHCLSTLRERARSSAE